MVMIVGDVRDQVGGYSPEVAPDAVSADIPSLLSAGFGLCDAVIPDDPQNRDAAVILYDFGTAPRFLTGAKLAFGPKSLWLRETRDWGTRRSIGELAAQLLMAGQLAFGPESLWLRAVRDWETRQLMTELCGGVVPREGVAPPRALTSRLLDFAGLPRGWDGYSGDPIANQTVERAIRALNYLYRQAAVRGDLRPPAPQVSPTPDGSIQLEWDYPGDFFLAVEVPAEPEPLTLYLEYGGGKEVEATADSPAELWSTFEVALKAARGE